MKNTTGPGNNLRKSPNAHADELMLIPHELTTGPTTVSREFANKTNELETLALDILEKMSPPERSCLTARKREALAKDALIFLFNRAKIQFDIEKASEIIAYRIKQTLKGVSPVPAKKIPSIRKCPTNAEQLTRHELLMLAVAQAKQNPAVQRAIIQQTVQAIKGKQSSEAQPSGTQSNKTKTTATKSSGAKKTPNALTETQSEDIIANFIHHAFTNEEFFTTEQALLIFQKLYLEKDPDKTDYTATLKIFLQNKNRLFQMFLESPNLENVYISTKEASRLPPRTDKQKEFNKWLYILLQHGNMRARNTALLSLHKFVRMLVKRVFIKNGLISVHHFEDLCQTVEEKLTEKLFMYDLKQSEPITFFSFVIKRIIRREIEYLDLVRQPSNVHYERHKHNKHPEYQPTAEKPVQIVYTDAMTGEKNTMPMADLFPEMHTTETPEDKTSQNEIDEIVMNALNRLNPRDREIIIQKSHGATMEAIGAVHGLTKQRIEQILKMIPIKLAKFRIDYLEAV